FAMQPHHVKIFARTYFDLYSEEYWLHQNNLIPDEMWTKRIANGVDVNLITYPLLVRGYYYWKEQGAFIHPEEFRQLIEDKIKKLEERLRFEKKCPQPTSSK